MSSLRTLIVVTLIIGLIAWFALPMYTVEMLSIVEIGATGFEMLWFGLTALFKYFSAIKEFEEALGVLGLLMFISGFPLLCLIGSLSAVRKEDYKDLILCSSVGAVMMLILPLLSLAAQTSVFSLGYIVILVALALTFAVSIPLYRDAPPTPNRTTQNGQAHPPVDPNVKFVNASGERLYKCYQCGKIAKRIEFSTIVQGTSYRGICRRCAGDSQSHTQHTAPTGQESTVPTTHATPATPTADTPTIKCCQCLKLAKRTEFYIVGINGDDNLGVCHQCYDKYY